MSYPFFWYIILAAIVVVVLAIIFRKKKPAQTVAPTVAEQPVAEPPKVATTTTATTTSSGYRSGLAKIFVNGGLPASGNEMGKLYVDGRSLVLKYTDAPIEISVSSGRHHIVIEGGHYGDARVDRTVDFGTSDVLTVDMPGGDDADLIRHQMISYSEYSRALRDGGFRVTRKTL